MKKAPSLASHLLGFVILALCSACFLAGVCTGYLAHPVKLEVAQ